jgi:DNA-binding FadR family transcriptional regulator
MAPFAQKRLLAHERHPGGRPSAYKPEYCEAVIEAMASGISLTAFAGTIRVSRECLYNWMSEHSEFSDAVSRGRPARTLALERKLLSARYGAQASAAIFALKNADPNEWRDMRTVQHDHNHAIANLTDEQLLAIASGRASDVTVIEHDDHALPSGRDTK